MVDNAVHQSTEFKKKLTDSDSEGERRQIESFPAIDVPASN